MRDCSARFTLAISSVAQVWLSRATLARTTIQSRFPGRHPLFYLNFPDRLQLVNTSLPDLLGPLNQCTSSTLEELLWSTGLSAPYATFLFTFQDSADFGPISRFTDRPETPTRILENFNKYVSSLTRANLNTSCDLTLLESHKSALLTLIDSRLIFCSVQSIISRFQISSINAYCSKPREQHIGRYLEKQVLFRSCLYDLNLAWDLVPCRPAAAHNDCDLNTASGTRKYVVQFT